MPELFRLIDENFSEVDNELQWAYLCLFNNHPLQLRNLLPPKSKVRQIISGKRKGQWKFNLDSQFRVIFTWQEKLRKSSAWKLVNFMMKNRQGYFIINKTLWIASNITLRSNFTNFLKSSLF